MNAIYPFSLSPAGEPVMMRGTWPAERRAHAAACDLIDLRSEIEIVTKQAPRWQVVSKPMDGSPSRALLDDDKAAYFDALARKTRQASEAANVRPPAPSPAERRQSVDELLFGRAAAKPEAEKYTEPVALLPRQAAIVGDAERDLLTERPKRSVDDILFGRAASQGGTR